MAVDPTKPQSMYKGHDHQEWQRLQPQLKIPKDQPIRFSGSWTPRAPSLGPGPGYPGGLGGDLPAAAAIRRRGDSPGLVATLGEKSAGLGSAVVEHVWPLKACVRLGERMVDAGRWWRLAAALPCALVAGGLAAGHGAQGALVVAALAVGAGVGWMVPTLLGALLALAAHLTGIAIGLGLIAGAIGLAYLAVTSIGH